MKIAVLTRVVFSGTGSLAGPLGSDISRASAADVNGPIG